MVLRSGGVSVIEDHRQTVAGALRELHVALDHGFEDQFLEMTLHLIIDLVGKSQSAVVHSQQEALDFELRVELALDDLNSIEELTDTLQRKVLALHRNDHRVGCRQGIDGNQPQ